jgi:hypothetical protein
MLLAQERGRLDPRRTPGANRERVNPQGTGDWRYDSQDVKFMEALLNTEGLIAGFSGHDHQNDWYEFLSRIPHIASCMANSNNKQVLQMGRRPC